MDMINIKRESITVRKLLNFFVVVLFTVLSVNTIAAGTKAGMVIKNRASLEYTVGSNTQPSEIDTNHDFKALINLTDHSQFSLENSDGYDTHTRLVVCCHVAAYVRLSNSLALVSF